MKIRMENAIVEFELECQIRNLSPRTAKHYVNNSKRFLKHIHAEYGVEYVNEVTHRHIKAYFSFFKNMQNTVSYINTICKSLRAFFKYCLNEDYIGESPCDRVGWLRSGKAPIKTFEDDEIRKMLKVYNGNSFLEVRNRAIIATFVDTGIRNLELCMLREDDIMRSRLFVNGKGNKERYVPTSPLLQTVLMQYRNIREIYFTDKVIHDDSFFLSRTGRRVCINTNERVVELLVK